MNERDESCQQKLNQAEHRNLRLLYHRIHKNVQKIVTSVVVSALLPLYETTTEVKIF